MYRLIIGAALFSLIQTPVLAGSFDVAAPSSSESNTNVDVGTSQKNDNATVQNNSGSVSNVAVQNVNLGNYSFGPGISCSTGGIALNGFANQGDYHNNYGATISYLKPLGGNVGRACKKLVNEIVKQKQLDTQVNMIKICADFKKSGIELDAAQFGELAKICNGVRVVDRGSNK